MSKAIATCTLLLGLTSCQSSDPVPVPLVPHVGRTYAGDNSIITEMKLETVLLVENSDDLRYYCSGVWINKETILTARHCIAASNLTVWEDFEKGTDSADLSNMPIDISTWNTTRLQHGISAESDETNDLSLIIVPHADPHMIAMLASRFPKQGDDLHFMGHPDEFTWTYTRGVVASDRYIKNFAGRAIETLQVSGFVYHGNSGGGAFDVYGNLVGLCSSLGRGAPGQAHYIPLKTIRAFLDKHHVSYTLD